MQDSKQLLAALEAGSESAAEEVFSRYLHRLTALARGRLSGKLAAHLDPEDVVFSAYRSFFVRARAGKFCWRRSGDLWRILAVITLRKVYRQAAFHRAARRRIDRQTGWNDAAASDPAPELAIELADQLEWQLDQLRPLHRRMMELRLRGWTVAEIAEAVERSERTVRRVLADVQARWEQELLPP